MVVFRSKLIKNLHTEYGEKLLDSLIKAVVTTLPSYTYHDIADVVHEALHHDRVSMKDSSSARSNL